MFFIDVRLKKCVVRQLIVDFVADQYKTQEMCHKIVSEIFLT